MVWAGGVNVPNFMSNLISIGENCCCYNCRLYDFIYWHGYCFMFAFAFAYKEYNKLAPQRGNIMPY